MKSEKKSSTARHRFSLPGAATPDTFPLPTTRRRGPLGAAARSASRSTIWGVRRGLQGALVGAAFVPLVGAFLGAFPSVAAAQMASPADAPRDPAAGTGAARRASANTDVFVDSAPGTYTVVRGDTLWGIAGRFLRQPWRWPEIWQVNRDQIRNPHWIYPGQVIVLDRATGTMRLQGGRNGNGTVKLSPQVRVEQSREAIPTIAPEAIEPYLTQPLVVETAAMLSAPRVVASRERVVLGAGDTAYVAGITDPSITVYQLFRPGRALKDPDTGEVIAYQADYLGTAQVTRPGEPATIAITSSKMEVNAGDRLVAATRPVVINYMPHAPSGPTAGRVVSAYSGVAYAGTSMIVAINRGSAEGIDVGTVLAIKTFGRTIVDRTNGVRENITLPEERKGLLLVFRVFDHIAYGLITSSNQPVEVGDSVTQP